MSIVLIKQYTESDNKETEGKALQAAFIKDGVNTIIVPVGLEVQWLPEIGNRTIAVIKVYGDTKILRKGADQLKKDLAENDISAIILPVNTDIEILHV